MGLGADPSVRVLLADADLNAVDRSGRTFNMVRGGSLIPETPAEPRRLHIGGQVRAAGWEVLDANPGPCVDHVGNARDLARFADNTFVQLYASHVVEHLDYREHLVAALKEWRRVLAPGGSLCVSVPDLDVLARLFIDRQLLSPPERFQVMRMMFGGHIDQYDYHQVGLNDEFLTEYLVAAGFTDVRRVSGFGLFQDASVLGIRNIPISLNMIAAKPPAGPLAAPATGRAPSL